MGYGAMNDDDVETRESLYIQTRRGRDDDDIAAGSHTQQRRTKRRRTLRGVGHLVNLAGPTHGRRRGGWRGNQLSGAGNAWPL